MWTERGGGLSRMAQYGYIMEAPLTPEKNSRYPGAGKRDGAQNLPGTRILPMMTALAGKYGAGDRSRTRDLLITNQLLYQLSYASLGWKSA